MRQDFQAVDPEILGALARFVGREGNRRREEFEIDCSTLGGRPTMNRGVNRTCKWRALSSLSIDTLIVTGISTSTLRLRHLSRRDR